MAASAGSTSRLQGRVVAGTAQPWRGASPIPELVGRRDELGRLEEELRRADAGEFRFVLLLGDAGVGKSRLGRELLTRRAQATGLFARAHPLGASAAFGVWIEALAPALELLSDDEVLEACGGLLDDLASLFLRVASVRGSIPERDPPAPRLFQGLGRVLGYLSRRGPLITLLDDVHFADASSWEALRYFARHLDGARLLVLATSQPAQLAAQEIAGQVLFELDEDGLMSRMQLGPLERPALGELAEAVIGQATPIALVDWLVERSGGNPLYAIELLRALLDDGADLSAPHLGRLPERLTERVAARVRRFEPEWRETLELIAVIGRPVSLTELTELGDVPLDRLGRVLGGLADAGIVLEEERGRHPVYDVPHPLVRDAIYQQTGAARRRLLHRQVARWLRSRGHLAEAALHFARSAEPGDDEAVDVLLDAMRQAEQREAFHEALDLQAELVELLPSSDVRWLEVLDAMYWRAEWLIDHRAETHAAVAIRALRAIDGLLEGSSDHARRATVKFRLASFLAWGTGELEAAQNACEQARELFARAGEERQVLLAAREVAWIKGLRGDLVAMGNEAERVAREAQARGERFIEMQGLSAVGYSANFRGAFAEGEAALRRAAIIAREDDKPYRLTVVLGVLAAGIACQGRTAEGAALLEDARASNPLYRDSILGELGAIVGWLAGDFPAASAVARDALTWVGGPTRRRAFGLVFGGVSALEVGDVAQAERLIARAHDVVGDRRWQFFPELVRWGEALVEWHDGRAGECVATLRAAGTGLLEIEARTWATYVLVDLAEAAGDAGDAAAAAGAADDLHAVARFVGLSMYDGLAATGSAWASLAAGAPEQAVEHARQATRLLGESGCRAFQARAQFVLGRSLPSDARRGRGGRVRSGRGHAWGVRQRLAKGLGARRATAAG